MPLAKESGYHYYTDNGEEFTEHQRMAQALRTHVFFAHPYHSWERGLNENTNGLIRQYFPQGDSLEKVSNQKLQWVMDCLNHRPRIKLLILLSMELLHE